MIQPQNTFVLFTIALTDTVLIYHDLALLFAGLR